LKKIYSYPGTKKILPENDSAITLTLILGLQGCELMLHSAENGEILRLEKYQFLGLHSQAKLMQTVADLLMTDEFFPVLKFENGAYLTAFPIKKINMIWGDTPFSFIPDSYSNPDFAKDILKIHSWVGPSEKINNYHFSDFSFNVFYTYPEMADNFISTSNTELRHAHLIIPQFLLSVKEISIQGAVAFLFQKSGWMTLILFLNGSLIFANHCFISTSADVLHFFQKTIAFFNVSVEELAVNYYAELFSEENFPDELRKLGIKTIRICTDSQSKNGELGNFPELGMLVHF